MAISNLYDFSQETRYLIHRYSTYLMHIRDQGRLRVKSKFEKLKRVQSIHSGKHVSIAGEVSAHQRNNNLVTFDTERKTQRFFRFLLIGFCDIHIYLDLTDTWSIDTSI